MRSSPFLQHIPSIKTLRRSNFTLVARINRSFWSSSSTLRMTPGPSTSVEEVQGLLHTSNRILALCGAGLSVASGLPTFRGTGGLWRNHEPTSLATPDAFRKDPALVWLFYAWRRHMVLKAQPNLGHFALAQLAKNKENFLCLTQNVDGDRPPLPSFLAIHLPVTLLILLRPFCACRTSQRKTAVAAWQYPGS